VFVFYLIIVSSPAEYVPDIRSELLSGESSPTATYTERTATVEDVSVWNCSCLGENTFLIFNCGAV
jgi:hypothetical protein